MNESAKKLYVKLYIKADKIQLNIKNTLKASVNRLAQHNEMK